ncbi:MAG TPA: hypothetical protein VL978_10465 [Puia sp.]|nr:hypothetical protein [Puia sp.]
MKTVSIRIGVSGKREISPEDNERVHKEMRSRIKNLLRHFRVEEFIGYTSLAAGADTIFAAVVVDEFRMPIHVVLPFPVEEYEKDFDAEGLRVFRQRLGQAAGVEVAGAAASDASVAPSDAGQRNAGYLAAGQRIADSCDEMVFVWDGMGRGGLGGTADIVGYWAEKKKEYPVPYIKVRAVKPDIVQEELIHGYAHSNRLAIGARNRYRQVWCWVIRLGWLTVGCFAVKQAFMPPHWSNVLILLEFLMVLAVYTLIFLARRRDYHGIYLRERMKAETYRVMRVFYHAGVQMGVSDRSRVGNKDIGELADSINRGIDPEEVRSPWYTQYVIRCLVAEQCAYHADKRKSIGNRNQIYEQVNFAIGILFIVNLAIHLAVAWFGGAGVEETWQYRIGVFFNLVLPASYAALEGFIYFNEWAVLKNYSTSAESSLREAGDMLPAEPGRIGTQEGYKAQAQVLHLISGVMLTDNRNWNLLLENKETYRMII